MDTPDLASGGIGALLGATLTAVFGWLSKRAEKAPDLQETLSKAVAGVVQHYTDALAHSDGEARALRVEVGELRRLVEDQTMRIEEQSARIAEQSSEIDGLAQHVTSLEKVIIDMGGTPPRRKRARAKAASEVAV